MISRRFFVKGLFLAAAATQIPVLRSSVDVVDYANAHGIDVLYVVPEDYRYYISELPPTSSFEDSQLADAGFENVIFNGMPMVPFKGNIHNKDAFSEKVFKDTVAAWRNNGGYKLRWQ